MVYYAPHRLKAAFGQFRTDNTNFYPMVYYAQHRLHNKLCSNWNNNVDVMDVLWPFYGSIMSKWEFFRVHAIISQQLDKIQIIFSTSMHHSSLSYHMLSVALKYQSNFKTQSNAENLFFFGLQSCLRVG